MTGVYSPVLTAVEKKKRAGAFFAMAGIIAAIIYLAELFHLLEEPLFSKVYYGNLNSVFYNALAAGFIFVLLGLLLRRFRLKNGCSPFSKHETALSIGRKAALYVMSVVPVLVVGLWLGERFKLVYELGERITGMTLLGNAANYLLRVARLFGLMCFLYFSESAFSHLFEDKKKWLPLGGIAAMLCFAVLELLLNPSMFSLWYVFLYLYCGIIYIVSQKRFAVTYVISIILFIL